MMFSKVGYIEMCEQVDPPDFCSNVNGLFSYLLWLGSIFARRLEGVILSIKQFLSGQRKHLASAYRPILPFRVKGVSSSS